MKFVLEIACDNAAFVSDDPATADAAVRREEVARILAMLAQHLRNNALDVERLESYSLYAVNGNRVGVARFPDA